jgi:hypothetical protein
MTLNLDDNKRPYFKQLNLDDTFDEIQDAVNSIGGGGSGLSSGNIIFISSVTDLPVAVGGVITLLANVTYFIVSDIDLNGSRLVGASDTTLIGGSSENSTLTSTGLGVGVALFTTEWTTPIRYIAFKDVDTAININGITNAPVALDWAGVNFVNVPNVGVINNTANFIFTKGAFLNSKGLRFTGSIGTVGIDTSIFVGDGSVGNIIELDASCIITRRFRIIYSSFVNFGSTMAINVNLNATIPTESYILDTINFSGGGTYLTGVMQTSNDALFKSCVGINNTAVNGQLYMQDNVTATVIANTTNFTKILGTTTASVDNSKFTHTNNRLTCDAIISRKYLIQCSLSFSAGNANVCEFGFYDSILGGIRVPSKTKTTANAAGRAENITFFCVVNMNINDYIEIHTRNTSTVTNITVDQMNFTITEII